MKKYIATIKDIKEDFTFKAYHDTEQECIVTEYGEEILGSVEAAATDKELVEYIYGMYGWGSKCFEIVDCIEYE